MGTLVLIACVVAVVAGLFALSLGTAAAEGDRNLGIGKDGTPLRSATFGHPSSGGAERIRGEERVDTVYDEWADIDGWRESWPTLQCPRGGVHFPAPYSSASTHDEIRERAFDRFAHTQRVRREARSSMDEIERFANSPPDG